MIVDSSILLAILFNEDHASWASDQLEKFSEYLCMSTVNLTEVLIRAKDRQASLFIKIEKIIEESTIAFAAPTVKQARLAAEARFNYPLNLGDCFAYALAKSDNLPLLTLDRDFLKTDIEVIIP